MSYAHSADHPLTVACPYFPPEEQARLGAELADILTAKLSMGPRTEAFERVFAEYCGARHAVAFPSCTSALEAALVCQGLEPGDEVLVPVQTFVATGMAVRLAGGRPVFTEIEPTTFSMDFEDAWARVTARTRGAIVVHYGGFVSPAFPAFVERMTASGRFVIEDDAHAHGAELGGRRAGSWGDAGCFSFYPTKIMTTGEGGMLVTSHPGIARTARSLQNRGVDLEVAGERYVRPGRNNRFTEIAAAMGSSQLRCLPAFLEARRATAALYDDALAQDPLLVPLRAAPRARPSYWRYVVLPHAPLDRVALKEALAADRITVDWAYDPPLHLQPVFRELFGTAPGMLPVAEGLMARHFCLPMHARLRRIDVEYVVERLLHHVHGRAP